MDHVETVPSAPACPRPADRLARAVQCRGELAVRHRVPRTPLALVASPAPRLSGGTGAVSDPRGSNCRGHPQGRLRVPQQTAPTAPSHLSATRGDPHLQASVQARRHGVDVWLSDPVYRPPAGLVVQSPSGGAVLSAGGEYPSSSGGGGGAAPPPPSRCTWRSSSARRASPAAAAGGRAPRQR